MLPPDPIFVSAPYMPSASSPDEARSEFFAYY